MKVGRRQSLATRAKISASQKARHRRKKADELDKRLKKCPTATTVYTTPPGYCPPPADANLPQWHSEKSDGLVKVTLDTKPAYIGRPVLPEPPKPAPRRWWQILNAPISPIETRVTTYLWSVLLICIWFLIVRERVF